jgi:DNA-binding transcriptional MerR regulator
VERWFGPAEMGQRLGVSPKALRVYERAGLVRPHRTDAGWRAYGPDQQARLHQVLALKRLGLSLARIGELLCGRLASLDAVLCLQQQVLETRRAETDRGLTLLVAARAKLAREGALSPDDLTQLTRETVMSKKMTDQEMAEVFKPLTDKHFTPEDQANIMERKDDYLSSEIKSAWNALIAEGDALVARREDPGSSHAADFAQRWMALVNKFTGGDASLNAKSSAMYKDAFSDPQTAGKMPFSQALWLFVGEAYRRRRASA